MSLEILEKLANESGNEEFVNAVNWVKESYKTNVERLSFLEKDKQKAIEKRDTLKFLVKNKFGLDEVTEDAIDKYLQSKSSSDGDIKNLTGIIESLRADKESMNNEIASARNRYGLEKALSGLGAIEGTENSKAYDIVLEEIRKNTVFDESGQVSFKDKDGITVRNSDGSPMSLSDKYNQLRESSDFSFLFKKKKAKAGSGATGQSDIPTTSKSDFGGSKQERLEAIKQRYNLN